MSSRKIEDLVRDLQPLASSLINKGNALLAPLHASVIITCTYRSEAEQAHLYAIGRTAPGKKVTNAPAGKSLHNLVTLKGTPAARAFDVAILIYGKLNWDLANPAWQTIGKLGVDLGLEWGGNWSKFREGPHFQLPLR